MVEALWTPMVRKNVPSPLSSGCERLPSEVPQECALEVNSFLFPNVWKIRLLKDFSTDTMLPMNRRRGESRHIKEVIDPWSHKN